MIQIVSRPPFKPPNMLLPAAASSSCNGDDDDDAAAAMEVPGTRTCTDTTITTTR